MNKAKKEPAGEPLRFFLTATESYDLARLEVERENVRQASARIHRDLMRIVEQAAKRNETKITDPGAEIQFQRDDNGVCALVYADRAHTERAVVKEPS